MHRGTHNDSKTEVPGRVGDQAHLPDCRDIHCEPCKAAGSVLEAQGYCKKCAEYLCQGCLDHHNRLKITRNHPLLDKANMPKDSQGRSSDLPCTEPCAQHAGETLQYFCADHEVIGCTVCTTMGHRSCNVQYLPDVAKGYKRTDEYKAFVGSVDELANALQHADQEIQDNLDTADDAHTAAIRDIEQFRDRINAYLDRKKKDLLATTKLQKEKNQKSMENARKDCQKIGKDVKDLQSQLRQEDNDLVKLFSTVKRSRTHVRSLQQKSSSLQERIQTPTFRFQPSAAIETLISNNTPLGEIIFNETEPVLGATASPVVLPKKPMSDMKLTHSSTIKLKSAADTKTPLYTRLEMLSDNRILVADCKNSSLQIVNTSNQQITSRLTLSGPPRDVTCLPGDQAAVTIPDQHKITVVSTKGKLSSVRDISVSGICCGITYTDGKLVVTYQDPGSRVEMLTMTGDVIKEIKYDRHGKQLFEYPVYITTQTTATATHLYVSDCVTDTIAKIAMTGDVVCQYSQYRPLGILALGDGYVAVCCHCDSSILLLEDTGAQMKKVKQWKCVERPQTLVMSAMRDTIYVSSSSREDSDVIHVYKLTEPVLGATASPVVLHKKPMSDMKLTQRSTIKLKSAADTNTPWYSGLEMLSDNRILVADCKNSSLQIVNTSSQQITSRLNLSDTPRDVICLPGDQAAVTIPDQHKITVVSTKGKLSSVRDISVSGICCGITYTDGKLVVTYQEPGRVEMLTMKGDVIKEIKYDRHGKQLFKYPNYITTQTTATATHLYVSDVGTDTITKIAMTGEVVCQYSQSGSRGIQALGDGYVAVCCYWDSSILLLEDTGAQMKKVKQWKCVEYPLALVMSATRDTIDVSSGTDADVIHVYKLTA